MADRLHAASGPGVGPSGDPTAAPPSALAAGPGPGTDGPGGEPDAALIARIRRGDALAMSSLYDRYAPTMLGLLAQVVGDRDLAEDLLQEAFFRVWTSADGYAPSKGSVRGWLFAIARNAGLDARRRRGARPVTADLLPPEEERSVEPDPDADVATAAWERVRHAQVRAALDALPEDQRDVVTLAYFGGLTRREIATSTGLPLGTVHTRARLALDKLRAALAGAEAAEPSEALS